jgi:hypothetical protein
LAAIVLHNTTGYHCTSYEFQPRPNGLIKQLLTQELRDMVADRTEHGAAQGPDLLMYKADLTDWFFCEVKGPGDPSETRTEEEVHCAREAERQAHPPPELQVGTPADREATDHPHHHLIVVARSCVGDVGGGPSRQSQRRQPIRVRTTK